MRFYGSGHELGDMFYDPTVDQMLNRGYSHLVNLYASTVGGILMETLGAWLETSGYGVLLHGAHGGAGGETPRISSPWSGCAPALRHADEERSGRERKADGEAVLELGDAVGAARTPRLHHQ